MARPQSSRRESSPDTAAELTSRPHPAQRRTLAVLSLAQIFVGLANGLAVGVGSLFVVRVTGVDALGGMAATLVTLGGAVMSAPLARLAARRGRRISLTTACVVALTATAVLVISGAFDLGWLVMIGFFGLGASSSLTLQARFAAVDLAQPHRRGRDMSLVIWMTTIGVVAGPSIVPLGDRLGVPLGLGELTGAYVLSGTGLLIVTFVVWVFLRPDPLQAAGAQAGESTANPETAFRILHHPRILWVVVMIASAHAMMVGIMAMTPVHLEHAGQALPLIMLAMSAHTGGMYVLSPVFGFLADSVGRRSTVLLGAFLLAASAAANLLLPESLGIVGLALLGFGWSAVTVAASALLNDETPQHARPVVQGRSDTTMGFAGAGAGALAGVVVATIGFDSLNWIMLIALALIVIGATRGLKNRIHSA
ncbi:MAG: MFS transporter [Agrococcus casei]|uniref:Major facilitator superfamily MFS_1 n=1 Tax=Agrococcus casei LMG 22410 TaxID=1255656 RepID=A0A1R4FWD7_9MICO|nr:MFS transporter [Agrococcus casei]SJM60239.1 major facilitator superfamily MFS_1 [Agrococcus casei LMG 22410]